MKYTKEERLDIGRRIYQGELTLAAAAVKYDVNPYTARDYFRLYKASNNIAVTEDCRSGGRHQKTTAGDDGIKPYEQMSRQELVDEILRIKAETQAARADGAAQAVGTIQTKRG